jgi:hypothetical protein
VLAALTGASSGVAVRPQPSQSANLPTSVAPAVSGPVAISADFIGDPFLPEQAQDNVLVVPTPELPAENQTELTRT